MINNILKKIEKADNVSDVKLAKHEVELASIADLQNVFKQGQSGVEKANALSYKLGDAVTAWNKTFSALKKEIQDVERSILEGSKLIVTINRQAKELGINEVPEVKKIEGYLSGLNKTATALRGAVLDNKNRIDTNF
jgi:hypothetical protein